MAYDMNYGEGQKNGVGQPSGAMKGGEYAPGTSCKGFGKSAVDNSGGQAEGGGSNTGGSSTAGMPDK